jgi:hypothetical protein
MLTTPYQFTVGTHSPRGAKSNCFHLTIRGCLQSPRTSEFPSSQIVFQYEVVGLRKRTRFCYHGRFSQR